MKLVDSMNDANLLEKCNKQILRFYSKTAIINLCVYVYTVEMVILLDDN